MMMQKIKEEIIQGYQVSYFIYPQTLQNINQKYFIVPAYMLIKKERKSLYGRKTKENRRFKWI